MENDGYLGLHESDEDLTAAANVVSSLLVIVVGLVFVYHLFLAWKVLPGAVLISGGINPTTEESAPVRTGNRFAQYLASTVLILAYFVLYCTFAYRRGDGWGYHYVLLAWVLSLLSTFDDAMSVVWLGITTGVFLQGVGSYTFQVLFHANNVAAEGLD